MTPQETFVTRLRRHRQRNRISLEEIAAETNVKPELLEGLEGNELSEWPRGVYARAWIRAYASAVGLDPADTVDEFCRLFPQGDRRARPVIEEIAAIVAHPSDYQTEVAPEMDRRRGAPEINVMPKTAWHAAVTTALANAVRTLWLRATNAMTAPQARKRQPRTTT
jgi:transcriptional regulator with XRE-family HTH domain